MLIKNKQMFQSLLIGGENILAFVLNQPESLIAVVKSVVYYC